MLEGTASGPRGAEKWKFFSLAELVGRFEVEVLR
jgi:hypothetical protein